MKWLFCPIPNHLIDSLRGPLIKSTCKLNFNSKIHYSPRTNSRFWFLRVMVSITIRVTRSCLTFVRCQFDRAWDFWTQLPFRRLWDPELRVSNKGKSGSHLFQKYKKIKGIKQDRILQFSKEVILCLEFYNSMSRLLENIVWVLGFSNSIQYSTGFTPSIPILARFEVCFSYCIVPSIFPPDFILHPPIYFTRAAGMWHSATVQSDSLEQKKNPKSSPKRIYISENWKISYETWRKFITSVLCIIVVIECHKGRKTPCRRN